MSERYEIHITYKKDAPVFFGRVLGRSKRGWGKIGRKEAV